MSVFKYYTDLDDHPMTGKFKVNFDAKLVAKHWLENHFNGTDGWEQITNVTPNNIYHIYAVECFGDVSDFFFIDDNGEESELMSNFFEWVE